MRYFLLLFAILFLTLKYVTLALGNFVTKLIIKITKNNILIYYRLSTFRQTEQNN